MYMYLTSGAVPRRFVSYFTVSYTVGFDVQVPRRSTFKYSMVKVGSGSTRKSSDLDPQHDADPDAQQGHSYSLLDMVSLYIYSLNVPKNLVLLVRTLSFWLQHSALR
jgi:hypothetical protein